MRLAFTDGERSQWIVDSDEVEQLWDSMQRGSTVELPDLPDVPWYVTSTRPADLLPLKGQFIVTFERTGKHNR